MMDNLVVPAFLFEMLSAGGVDDRNAARQELVAEWDKRDRQDRVGADWYQPEGGLVYTQTGGAAPMPERRNAVPRPARRARWLGRLHRLLCWKGP